MPGNASPSSQGCLSCASPAPGLDRLFRNAPGRTVIILARISLAEKLPSCCLGIEEQIREKRFRQPADRLRFRAAHFIKRMGCAAALGVAPADLAFTHEPGGRPFLRDFPGLFFSLSHNGQWAGAAFGRISPLGFDVQRPLIQPRLVSCLFPGPAAQAGVTPERFALRWALLEAAAKQDGLGLPYPLPFLRLEKTGSERIVRLELRGNRLFAWHATLGDGGALALASAMQGAVTNPAVSIIS